MNDNVTNNEQAPITSLDDDTIYRASIHYYSKGKGEAVTLAVDVSHVLADEMEGNQIPASYMQVYEQVMQLRRNAVLYPADSEDTEFLKDEHVSPESKAAHVLEKIAAQEEALTSVLN